MIFYKNLKKHKQTQEKNLTFSIFDEGLVSNVDDYVSKPNACKQFYNLSYLDGALKTGIGIRDFEAPATLDDLQDTHTFNFSESMNEIKDMWFHRWFDETQKQVYYQLLFLDNDNTLYMIPLIDEFEGYVWIKSQQLHHTPYFQCNYRIDNRDVCLFFTDGGMYAYAYTGAFQVYTDVPPIISSVVHYNNFFGITNTDRNTLMYTDNTDLSKWASDKTSTIEFLDNAGAFNKVVAFNDYVYLFREYGITKISIYTSKSDFSFTHIYTSPSKIYENSVCVCGDKVLFMTRDGLYSFSGSSVNKIAQKYDAYFKNLDNSNCTSACLNGKYYLATKCNFADDNQIGCEAGTYVNNVLFEIDINNYNLNVLRGVDIKKLLAVNTPYMSKVCANFYNGNKLRLGEIIKSGNVFGLPCKKSWASFETDLGYRAKRKKIKEIVITTVYDCEVEICSDEETKSFKFSGNVCEQQLKINIYGKSFKFFFKTDKQNCDIKKPMLIFDVLS